MTNKHCDIVYVLYLINIDYKEKIYIYLSNQENPLVWHPVIRANHTSYLYLWNLNFPVYRMYQKKTIKYLENKAFLRKML